MFTGCKLKRISVWHTCMGIDVLPLYRLCSVLSLHEVTSSALESQWESSSLESSSVQFSTAAWKTVWSLFLFNHLWYYVWIKHIFLDHECTWGRNILGLLQHPVCQCERSSQIFWPHHWNSHLQCWTQVLLLLCLPTWVSHQQYPSGCVSVHFNFIMWVASQWGPHTKSTSKFPWEALEHTCLNAHTKDILLNLQWSEGDIRSLYICILCMTFPS